jgi:hypothetical protein
VLVLLTMLLSPFPTRIFRAGAILVLALVAGAAAPGSVLVSSAAAAERWIAAEPRDSDPVGYALYVEDTDDAYPGYKAEGFVDAAPEAAAARTWTLMTGQDFVPKGQTRTILRQTDQELVLHTFIDMPAMVADRDLTIRITQSEDPTTGVRRISWQSVEGEAPPPRGRVVRIPDARGYWEFAPDGPDRSRATYMTRADLGGWLPARLVSPLMRDQVAGDVARLQKSLRRFTVSAAPAD